MSRPSFGRGAVVAAVLGIAASAVLSVFSPLAGADVTLRWLIPGLAFAYILQLLGKAGEKTGRITALAAWLVATLGVAWLSVPLALLMLVQVAAIWLVRSVFFYTSLVPALIDLVLNAAAVILAVWAQWRTGSVFLATWCFFLVQAASAAIPRSPAHVVPARDDGDNHRFDLARRQAEAALAQLFSK